MTRSRADIEASWLDYAWDVVRCGASHLRTCEASGGSDPELDPTVRYPGYLGRDYDARRGVLCVGLVHRASPDRMPGQEHRDIGNSRIVEAITQWRSSPRTPETDAAHLETTRSAYESVLADWTIWRLHFEPVVRALGLSERSIAMTNLAKCRADLIHDSGRAGGLAALCQDAFPIGDLIQKLKPTVILVAARRPAAVFTGKTVRPLVVSWHGRNMTDEMGRRRRDWLPVEAARILAHWED